MSILAALALVSWAGYTLLAGRPPRNTSAAGQAGSRREGLEERLDRSLGELARAAVLAAGGTLSGPRLDRAVTEVRQRLTEAEGDRGNAAAERYSVEILILDTAVVNAQALPGGLIVIHRGLLESLDSAEQLAAVVAHEMAHVHYRDSLAVLRRQLGLSFLLSLVGLPEGADAVKRLVEQAAHIRYSRRVEARADRYALQLLADARLDPARLADALQRIADSSGRPQGRLPELLRYLDDHPTLDQRVEEARARSLELGVQEEPLPVPEGWEAVLTELADRRSRPAGPPGT